MNKIYGYCRTARAEGNSMAVQIALVEDYCKAKGMKLTACFCDDGVSAHNLSRVQLDKLFNVLENGDTVIIKDASRLARDPVKQKALVDKIHNMGAEIVYVEEANEGDNMLAINDWLNKRFGK